MNEGQWITVIAALWVVLVIVLVPRWYNGKEDNDE